MDWIATVCTLMAVYLLGSQNKQGFIAGIIGNVLWTAYAFQTEQLSILALNVVFAVMNARGFLNWTLSEIDEQADADW